MNPLDQPLQIALQKIQSGVTAQITEANNQISVWENESLPNYLVSLFTTLSNSAYPLPTRSLAGVLLRGTLQAKDQATLEQKGIRWLNHLPEDLKAKIKAGLLGLLVEPSSELKIKQTVAQVIAAIALVEIPERRWNDLFPLLLQYVTNAQTPVPVKVAALDCIGFICEIIKPELLEAYADQILTGIVHCIRPEQPNIEIKRSALQTLLNAMDFCRQNFENPQERDILMNVILAAITVLDESCKTNAFSILVEVGSLHYEKLPPYMQTIFKLSLDAISDVNGPESVAKQAIEFWSTICEEELSIIEETEYAKEYKLPPPTRKCHFFIKGVIQYLVPVLTETLARKTDSDDTDEFTVAMAGGICLHLIAQTAEDDIVPFVAPFIERHIVSQDWRYREAAVLAFGSILEGPRTVIGQLINEATPLLLQLMKDQKTAVKDSTAWTIGQILKFHHKAVLPHAQNILIVMGEALNDKPRVASNAAWAIHNLAYAFREEDPSINPINKYFDGVVKSLLMNSDRPDADEENFRVSIYEALNVVLANSPPEAIPALENLLIIILDKMDRTFLIEVVHQDDQNKQNQLQGLLCGVIQVIAQKIEQKSRPYADRIMDQLLRLFKSKKDSSVYEEAFLTVAVIANLVESDFSRYMEAFYLNLCAGLENWQDYQVCGIAVGVVGDCARALGVNLTPFCDRIITLLLHNLQNKSLDRSVKPPILSCFGDIALAIGGNFIKYLEVVMGMLKQAADTVMKTNLAQTDDYDLVEYMNSLREGIFEAYTGIIQGLKSDKKGEYILNHANSIVNLILNVACDPRRSEPVAICAVGIVGDLASTLGARIKPHLQQQPIVALIKQTAQNTTSTETKETAEWAFLQIS